MRARVVVRDAVAAGDYAELNRRAARAVDAVLDLLGQLAQVDVAGDHLVIGVGDADNGPAHVVVRVAAGLVAGLVGDEIKGVERAYSVVVSHSYSSSTIGQVRAPQGSTMSSFSSGLSALMSAQASSGVLTGIMPALRTSSSERPLIRYTFMCVR